MDIRQLKYFIAAVEQQNLSLAAKSLFITQPTLSQSLKKIEMELNTHLFKDNDKKFQLTNTGEMLYQKGKKIVADFDSLLNEIQAYEENTRVKIHVGLTALFAIQYMKQISKFIASHPSVDLHIVQDGSRHLQKLLSEGKIEIGLLSFPILEDNIEIEALTTTNQGYDVSIVMPKDHPLAERHSIGFKELESCNFSTLTDHYMLGKMLPERGRHYGFEPQIVFVHNDWEVLIHSVKDLNSICLLPNAYQEFSNIDGLAWVPLADQNNYYPTGIALRKGFVCNQTLNEFISIIKSN